MCKYCMESCDNSISYHAFSEPMDWFSMANNQETVIFDICDCLNDQAYVHFACVNSWRMVSDTPMYCPECNGRYSIPLIRDNVIISTHHHESHQEQDDDDGGEECMQECCSGCCVCLGGLVCCSLYSTHLIIVSECEKKLSLFANTNTTGNPSYIIFHNQCIGSSMLSGISTVAVCFMMEHIFSDDGSRKKNIVFSLMATLALIVSQDEFWAAASIVSCALAKTAYSFMYSLFFN